MEGTPTEYIVGAVVIVAIVIREIFAVGRVNQRLKKIDNIERMTRDLYKWHDITDDEGVKIWYVRRSLEDAIKNLAENISKQTEIFQALIVEFRNRK